MRVGVATVLAAPLDRVLAEVERPRLLVHVAAPLITFEAIDPPQFPDRWTPGRYLVGMKLFGRLPYRHRQRRWRRLVARGFAYD